jgi:hypothetical protein
MPAPTAVRNQGNTLGDVADDPSADSQPAGRLVQVCQELPGPALEHVLEAHPDDDHAQESATMSRPPLC